MQLRGRVCLLKFLATVDAAAVAAAATGDAAAAPSPATLL